MLRQQFIGVMELMELEPYSSWSKFWGI